MPVSVFCGVSVDGFLARRDGSLDFLDAGGAEPHGYEEFIATVDTVVWGRNTYDFVRPFKSWPYPPKMRVVVLSHRPLEEPASGWKIEHMSGEPTEIIGKLAATGANHLYVDGGKTIQEFLRAGLVDRMIVTRVPVLIGEGIPLFGSLPQDVKLKHIGTREYAGGLVQTEYEVVR